MSNVGTPDRIARAIVGLALIVAPLLIGGVSGLVIGLSIAVGAVLVATAVFGFCPIYALFGLSSKRRATR